MIETIIYIVDSIGVAVVLAMLILFLRRGVKKPEEKYLLFALLLVQGMVLIEFFTSMHYAWDVSVTVLELMFGPLLITYIQKVGRVQGKIPLWTFYIPSLLLAIFLILGVATGLSEEQFYYSPVYMTLEFVCFIAVMFFAVLATLYLQRVRYGNVEVEAHLIQWISILVFCFFGLILVEFIYLFIYSFSDGSEFLWLTDSFISLGLNCILLWKGIEYGFFVDHQVGSNEDLSDRRWIELFEQIDTKVKKEGLYLQSEMRINELAREMSTNGKYISRAINLGAGESVTNYLNMMRLTRFKELIGQKENAHMNIYALAEECGFSSKSSFNRFFKLREGITPSEYKDQLLKN